MTDKSNKQVGKITTKHLLKFLPLGKSRKEKLLAKFDNLSDDQRFEIERILWTMFYKLYDDRVKLEFQKAVLAAREGKGKLKGNLYKEVEEKVFKEMRRELEKEMEKETVGEVRGEIEKVARLRQDSGGQVKVAS